MQMQIINIGKFCKLASFSRLGVQQKFQMCRKQLRDDVRSLMTSRQSGHDPCRAIIPVIVSEIDSNEIFCVAKYQIVTQIPATDRQ